MRKMDKAGWQQASDLPRFDFIGRFVSVPPQRQAIEFEIGFSRELNESVGKAGDLSR